MMIFYGISLLKRAEAPEEDVVRRARKPGRALDAGCETKYLLDEP